MQHASHTLDHIQIGLSLGNFKLILRYAVDVHRTNSPRPRAGTTMAQDVEHWFVDDVNGEGDGAAVTGSCVAWHVIGQ